MKKVIILIVCMMAMRLSTFGFDKGVYNQQLCFEENNGQIISQQGSSRSDIDYTIQSPGLNIFIGKGAIHYQFYKIQGNKEAPPSNANLAKGKGENNPQTIITQRVDVQLLGANTHAVVISENGIGGVNHYYTNSKSKEGLATRKFQKITYKDIYPGIDWILYMQSGALKYDFVVHPGADSKRIQLSYKGASHIALSIGGTLGITTAYGTITEQAPISYQQETHKAVASRFKLTDNKLSFDVEDNGGTTVIDPGVAWATYYGGGTETNTGNPALDAAGNIYICGITTSINNIATTGSYQDTIGSLFNSYLAKFDSLGNCLWATYYGGDSASGSYIYTFATAIACDNGKYIYLTGTTNAANGIATPGSHLETVPLQQAGYLVQFDSAGIRQWGTYYGGNDGHGVSIWGIAIDKTDNSVYLCGSASCTDGIATAGCYQDTIGPANGPTPTGGFLAKFNINGSLQWGTYYGDGNFSNILNVACDNNGNVYFVGSVTIYANTVASSFVTPGTFQSALGYGGDFLVKFNSAGTRQWGTFFYVTGSGAAEASLNLYSVACDANNHVYVSGGVSGLGFGTDSITTADSYESTAADLPGNTLYLLAQFTSEGQRNWCTYYGPSLGYPLRIACDANDFVYICGITPPEGILPFLIATPGSYQDTANYQDSLIVSENKQDAFLVQFDSTGTRHWGTYYGAGGEQGIGVACDNNGNIYLSGSTASPMSIATPGSYQDSLIGGAGGSGTNAFLVRFIPDDIAVELAMTTDTVCADSFAFSIILYNQGRMPVDSVRVTTISTNNTTGQADTFYATTAQPLLGGNTTTLFMGNINLDPPAVYTVKSYIPHIAGDTSLTNDTASTTIVSAYPFANGIAFNNPFPGMYSFSLDSAVNAAIYHWDFGDGGTATTSTVTHIYTGNGSYTVTLIISNSCGADTINTTVTVSNLGVVAVTGIASLNLYPNPNNGQFTLSGHFNNDGIVKIEIVDVTGRVLYTEEARINGCALNKQINMGKTLVPGIYTLHATDDNGNNSAIPFDVLK